MNNPAISSVLPANIVERGRGRHGDSAEASGFAPSFSRVLSGQRKGEAHAGTTEQLSRFGLALPARAGGAAKEDASNTELSEHAAEQGLTLPQIALNIAAEVAAVQQPSASRQDAAGLSAQAHAADAAQERMLRPTRLGEAVNLAASQARNASARINTDLLTARRAAEESAALKGKSSAEQASSTPALTDLMPMSQAQTSSAQAGQFGPGRSASIAGAKQAVLTMQARLHAAGQKEMRITVPDFLANPTQEVNGGLNFAQVRAESMQAASDMAAPAALGSNTPAGTLHASPLSGTTANPLGQGAAALIATPLNNPQWSGDFARQFITISQSSHNVPQTAELRLDPPELGPLRIAISVSDNVAHAVIVSPHAAVRQAVENSLPQLQQMLADAGISLGQTSVSDQGQSEQAFNEVMSNGNRRSASSASVASTSGMDELARPAQRSPAPDALVDTFA